ncbi:aminopeptidase [Peptoniphilus equinus]|uniref:Aminopeptidase n=1 Tax=Peptoniphilus equinus TaxID=3016343 RepID=A0ABY7QV67_9FIRM|nr:aminopeptidase [Peptoniphilus equinus]WBW50291.1 aminopeptidase [Peptoniphilus equinus]
MTFEDKLKKYAELIVGFGIKVKEGDYVVISGQVENYDFLRALAALSYDYGAKNVKLTYLDQTFSELKYRRSPLKVLTEMPDYVIDEKMDELDKQAKFIKVIGADPNGFKNVDPQKLGVAIKARSTALREVSKRTMNSETPWVVVGAATEDWAKVVFPDMATDQAKAQLWEAIFETTRVNDEDTLGAWEAHAKKLEAWSAFLNDSAFERLHITTSKGTDLTIGLPKGYIFSGATEVAQNGEAFVANMPTEEVFTLPHKDQVNGRVYATKPLNYNGTLIDDFYLDFKDGEVVNFKAGQGEATLRQLLQTDEGSKRIGEVALVPYDSPISNSKILFFETLFDENAACHLALGKAYPTSLKGGETMDTATLLAHGANDSVVHVDFMIGDETTQITAEKNGEVTPIFIDGNFAEDVL